MTLTRASVLRCLVLALAATIVISAAVVWLRARDHETSLRRVAAAYQTEVVRQSCESDPQWFLAGPRSGRPTAEQRSQPDADVRVPRPSAEELPFEVFPYDDEFTGTSVASPRFPEAFRRPMRATPPERSMFGSYAGKAGTGIQIAQLTGWTQGPCAVLLFRMQPQPRHLLTSVLLFSAVFGICFVIALLSPRPAIARIRQLAAAARASARDNYSGMVPIKGDDEISSLGAVFNQTASDIRQRIVDAQDREEALRRFVVSTTDGVAEPLAALKERLAGLDRLSHLSGDAGREVKVALHDAHQVAARLENLAAVAELRKVSDTSPREPVDLRAIVDRVVATRGPLARASDVTIAVEPAGGTTTIPATRGLIEQAVSNLVDNAILYNKPGGKVRIELHGYERDGHRFSLRVTDTGRGVSDEEFAGLTANKRFRGDEATSRRPGGRGLGLALTREIADRFGLQLELRRPTTGGLEAELSTRAKS